MRTIQTVFCAFILLTAVSASAALTVSPDIQRGVDQPSLLISADGKAVAVILPASSAVETRNSSSGRTTTLHQQFVNASDETVTASYAVPLRRGARISNLQIIAGSVKIDGQVTTAASAATLYTSQTMQISPKRKVEVVTTIVEPLVIDSLETPAGDQVQYATVTLPEDVPTAIDDTLVTSSEPVDPQENATLEAAADPAIEVVPPAHGRAPLALSVGMMAVMLASTGLALRGVGVL